MERGPDSDLKDLLTDLSEGDAVALDTPQDTLDTIPIRVVANDPDSDADPVGPEEVVTTVDTSFSPWVCLTFMGPKVDGRRQETTVSFKLSDLTRAMGV